MAIYVDVSSAVQGKAGLKRYAESLVTALRPLLGDRLRLFQNAFGRLGPLPGWEDHPTVGARLGYKPWRASVLAGQWLHLPLDALTPEAELFHATEHLLPHFRRTPTVLTVHDLIFERLPQSHRFRNYVYLKTAMPLFCRRATAIIAISEATKADLMALYGIAAERITVIPEAAAPHFRPVAPERADRARARYHLPPRYILAVGTIEPRKNLTRLAQACGPLFQEGLADALVIVGARGWLEGEFYRYLEGCPWRERIIFPGYVADEDLPALYSAAAITAQASLYEGFGLPVLEAMACGSPVCASAASSLPEVGGDAALYFDPLLTEQMTDALRRVLRDPSLAQEMREKGLAQAARYSWEQTARQTLALYDRVTTTA
jgi:glycosyltransferase involved in cell wall biosynthesis